MISEIKTLIKTLLNRKKDPFLVVPKTRKNRLAYLISRVLGPTPLVSLTFLLVAVNSGIGINKALWVYPLIFLVSIATPMVFTIYLVLSKKVKDIEWSDIKDRGKYMPPIVIYSLGSLTFLIWLLTTSTLFRMTLLFDAIVFVMILFYKYLELKASVHIMFATIAFASIILFFGFQYFWIFIFLLPIMWARRTLKVHTWPELLVGFFVPATLMIAALLIFGWPHI